jgi:UDP-N-acetylglucosamine 2-epimerase (non-hydrolysing)
MKKKILFIFGTRPEAIKLFPLIHELKKQKLINFKICITSQHKGLLMQVLRLLNIKVDYDLNLMSFNQKIENLNFLIIKKLNKILDIVKPDLVIVQGDTITSMSSALAAKLKKIKVAHVEAGLRTFDNNSPWPEEINRTIISRLADINFCPTKLNIKNLERENIKNLYLTGNTIVDAIRLILKAKNFKNTKKFLNLLKNYKNSKIKIFFTVHRRENFGKPLKQIFHAIKEISKDKNVEIIYPMHPNPNIKKNTKKIKNQKNIKIIKPLNYHETLQLLKISDVILSDSGGIQEEASVLNKKILILRDKTERPEILGKIGYLVGSDAKKIISKFNQVINESDVTKRNSIYGNGDSAIKIIKLIKKLI